MARNKTTRYNTIKQTPVLPIPCQSNMQTGVFFMSRVYDVATTTLNTFAFGYAPEIEANPLMRALMVRGYGWFLLYQLVISILVAYLLSRFRLGRPVLTALTIISLLVGTSNLIIYLVVR